MANLVARQPASLREAGGSANTVFRQQDRHLISELEKRAGGVLDDRYAAADLRDRLQREHDARELAS